MNKKWSRNYNCCIECGTIKVLHAGYGYCRNCYMNKYYQKNDEYRRYRLKQSNDYNHENREKRILYKHNYYKNNKRKCKLRNKLWMKNNLEKVHTLQKRWRDSHKDRIKKYNKKYLADPKRKLPNLLHNHKRIALKKNVNFWSKEMDIQWQKKLNITKGYCPSCGKYIGGDKLTMDHIIPLSKNGIHHIDNAQPMCKSCNSSKSNKMNRRN